MADTRVYELRTYYTHPGRMAALNARFRDHTLGLFARHGIDVVGFWQPESGDHAENTLIYLLAFPNRAALDSAWAAFRADPEWNEVRTASERDGKIVDRIESVVMHPTDYSPTL